MSSERQIEANRRNAQKSTGPRSVEGKERSRFNAVKHGMTTKFDVLPGETCEAFLARIAAWTEAFQPRNQAERDLAEQAARISWQLDRVEKAQVDRITANILRATAGQNEDLEREVPLLGQLLLPDTGEPPVAWSCAVDDPNHPAQLVLQLESSAPGCRWLLDRWAELRSLLEGEHAWQSADKVRAIRLLGKEPRHAIDDRQVALVFLACHTIDSRSGELFHEIENGLNPKQWEIVRDLLAQQPAHWLRPRDQAEAREVLFQIVDRTMGRLERKLEVHQRRDDLNAAYAADLFAVDNSVEGDRLRHYALSCGRDLIRIVETFVKMRKAGNTDKLIPVAVTTEASTDSTAAVDPRISQIEPNFPSSSPNTTAEEPILVPKVPVEMPSATLCVVGAGTRTQERPGRHSHAEHGNEMDPLARVGVRQWPDSVEVEQDVSNFQNNECAGIEPSTASDLEISRIEPNFPNVESAVIEPASPGESKISSHPPVGARHWPVGGSGSADVSPAFPGRSGRDARAPGTEPRTNCWAPGKISQIEPNFVSIRNTKEIEFGSPERTVRFRVERTHHSTRRKWRRHGRRDDLFGRLKTREPTRGARTAPRLCDWHRAYVRCKTHASSRPLRPPRVAQRDSLSRCFLTRIAA